MDDHARGRARRIAQELGYVAFCLDHIGDGRRLSDLKETMAALGPLMKDPLETRGIGKAGLDVLTAHERVDTPRIATIGYCFGGTMSLALARAGEDLEAVVGFHSGLSTARPEDARAIEGSCSSASARRTRSSPPAQRTAFEEEMMEGGVNWEMNLYGEAAHSFTNPAADELETPGIGYHAETDRRSWAAMLDLFREDRYLDVFARRVGEWRSSTARRTIEAGQMNGRMTVMTRLKVSATVRPERLALAQEITGKTNVSELIDDALSALIEREQERRWLDAHPDRSLPVDVPVDLSDLPWDDEA